MCKPATLGSQWQHKTLKQTMSKTMRCPNCGNYVEGKKIKSYSNKVARQGAKSLVHGATSVGGTTTGAAIGTAILPGIGTVLGAAAGFIGSAMFNQKVNESIDKAGDYIEDEFANLEYEYVCPKCGKKWTSDQNVAHRSSKSSPKRSRPSSSPASTAPKRITSTNLNDVQSMVINVVTDELNTSINLDLKTLWNICRPNDKKAIIQQIENKYHIEFSPEMVDQFKTLGDLADYVEKNMPFSASAEFIVLNTAREVLGPKDRNINSNFAQMGQGKKKMYRNALEKKCKINISDSDLLSFNTYQDIAIFIITAGWRPPGKDNSRIEVTPHSQTPSQSAAISSNSSQQSISNSASELKGKDEQEYLEALKDFLEDGEISDRERRLLDRVRKSLGISEQRAAELESSLKTPQLTEDEQEYLDMYREYADEGEITEKARRRLDRFASALGISPGRMRELERVEP